MASKTALVPECGRKRCGKILIIRNMRDVVVENIDAVWLCNYGYTPSQYTPFLEMVLSARAEMFHKQKNYCQLPWSSVEPVVSSFMPRHVTQNAKSSCYKELTLPWVFTSNGGRSSIPIKHSLVELLWIHWDSNPYVLTCVTFSDKGKGKKKECRKEKKEKGKKKEIFFYTIWRNTLSKMGKIIL